MSFAIHYLPPDAFDERISISCADCFVLTSNLTLRLLLAQALVSVVVRLFVVAGRLGRMTPPTRRVLVHARAPLLPPPLASAFVAARNCLFHLLVLMLMLTLRYNDGPLWTTRMPVSQFGLNNMKMCCVYVNVIKNGRHDVVCLLGRERKEMAKNIKRKHFPYFTLCNENEKRRRPPRMAAHKSFHTEKKSISNVHNESMAWWKKNKN